MKLLYRVLLSCTLCCVAVFFRSSLRFSYGQIAGTQDLLMMPGGRQQRESRMHQGAGELLGWAYLLTDDRALSFVKHSSDVGGRMIVEYDTYGSEHASMSHVKELVQPQVVIKGDGALGVNYTHAKVFVRDNQAIIQTFNLAKSSFEKNREFAVLTQEPKIVGGLHDLFQADRNGRPLKAGQIASGLVVCPQNCYQIIATLLGSAKSSIEIYNQYITDPDIITLLQHSPATVQAILPDTPENAQQWSDSNAIRLLQDYYVHAKIILVDHHILLVSSINLSENAIHHNREIGLLVSDSGLVQKIDSWFRQDWDHGIKPE